MRIEHISASEIDGRPTRWEQRSFRFFPSEGADRFVLIIVLGVVSLLAVSGLSRVTRQVSSPAIQPEGTAEPKPPPTERATNPETASARRPPATALNVTVTLADHREPPVPPTAAPPATTPQATSVPEPEVVDPLEELPREGNAYVVGGRDLARVGRRLIDKRIVVYGRVRIDDGAGIMYADPMYPLRVTCEDGGCVVKFDMSTCPQAMQ